VFTLARTERHTVPAGRWLGGGTSNRRASAFLHPSKIESIFLLCGGVKESASEINTAQRIALKATIALSSGGPDERRRDAYVRRPVGHTAAEGFSSAAQDPARTVSDRWAPGPWTTGEDTW
jgi:hypothetical protein